MNIVIPSYKRANNLKGKDYFTMAKYVVPESQKREYVEVLGEDRVISIPDSEDGSIGRKRNWILKNIPRPLIMIDDDVEYLKIYNNRKEKYYCEKLDKELLEEFFLMLINLSDEFGCKMFGITPLEDARTQLDFCPFSLTKVCLGPFQGHLEHDLLFDELMGSKDDYDMFLQQMRKYKKVLRYNKALYKDPGNDDKVSGGIVSYRSLEKETEWCKAIMNKWGSKVIKYRLPAKKKSDLLNASVVNHPIKGV